MSAPPDVPDRKVPDGAHEKLIAFWHALQAEPLPPRILRWAPGSSTRGMASQSAALTRGASRAAFGQSPHNFSPSLAVDVYPIIRDAAGKQIVSPDAADYALIGIVARRLGLSWGGDWRRFKDRPHVELPDWKIRAGLVPEP